jgi:hypothetical protein
MGFDFRKIREISGHEVYGFLGMSFLARYVVHIDFDRGEVIFLRAVPRHAGQRLPIRMESGWPTLELTLPGPKGRRPHVFVLDTGACGFGSGDLRSDQFEQLVKEGKLLVVKKTLFESAAGSSTSRIGQLDMTELPGFRHRKLLFGEAQRNLLGLNYLSRFIVTFDFPGRGLYLVKGERYGRPDLWDHSGLHVFRPKGQTAIHSIDPGSAGAAVGLKAGDVLLTVDGRPTDRMTLHALRQLLCAEGRTIRLTVRRGGQELAVTLKLTGAKIPAAP